MYKRQAYFILVNAVAAWTAFDRMNKEYLCFWEFFIMGQFNKYAYFPLMTLGQQFNPYVDNVKVCRWTAIVKYNVEKRQARGHALRKAKSMKEHIGLLRDEVKDKSSSVHREKFFVDMAEAPDGAADARMVGDEGNEHLCIHHLDAIVAHHEMGDQHHDDDVELPPSMFSGSGSGNANAAAATAVGGGVAAVVAAGLAGGAPVDALCRV